MTPATSIAEEVQDATPLRLALDPELKSTFAARLVLSRAFNATLDGATDRETRVVDSLTVSSLVAPALTVPVGMAYPTTWPAASSITA